MLSELVVAAMMPFYLLGTGPFMQDMGVSGKNVSAAMGIAQAAQAAATMLLLGWFLEHAGFRWTFVAGVLCLTALYATYSVSRRASWIVLVQALFGLECVFCMAGGQMFVNAVAPAQINASAQSLIFIATYGTGQFLGTQCAGHVMERNRVNGKFQWPKIWLVPLTTLLIVLEGVSPESGSRALLALEKGVGFRVADKSLSLGIPFQLAAQANGDVGQVTRRGGTVLADDVGDWRATRLHAIEETAHVIDDPVCKTRPVSRMVRQRILPSSIVSVSGFSQ